MIQRIQSIFLAAIGISMIVMIFVPIWEKTNQSTDEVMMLSCFKLVHQKLQDGEYVLIKERTTIYIAALALLASANAFYSLFSYKNRMKQIKIGLLTSLLLMGVLGVSMYYGFYAERIFLPDVKGVYKLGFYLPGLSLVFNVVANRFIRRDENLVRSTDRIR